MCQLSKYTGCGRDWKEETYHEVRDPNFSIILTKSDVDASRGVDLGSVAPEEPQLLLHVREEIRRVAVARGGVEAGQEASNELVGFGLNGERAEECQHLFSSL